MRFSSMLAQRLTSLVSAFRHEPVFAATGWFFVLSLLVTLPALWLDDRLFQGENVWIKPIKFQIALAIYLLTLAAYARWIPQAILDSLAWRSYAMLVVFSCLFEIAVIGGAAMYATASHYNNSSVLMVVMYGLMGFFAVMLTSASLVAGIIIWRNSESTLPGALHLSIALGLILTFVLTLPVAGTLSSQPGHFIGTPATGASVPFMGWSREVGDLRVAHFIATHALHALPLAGLLIVSRVEQRQARRLVIAFAVIFTLLVALAFLQALAGKPLLAIRS